MTGQRFTYDVMGKHGWYIAAGFADAESALRHARADTRKPSRVTDRRFHMVIWRHEGRGAGGPEFD